MDSDFDRSKLKLAREQKTRVNLARKRMEKEENTKTSVMKGVKAAEAMVKERKIKQARAKAEVSCLLYVFCLGSRCSW